MTDRIWGALAEKVESGWGPERDRAVWVKIQRLQARRRAAVRAGTAAFSLALVAGAVGAFLRLRTPASEQAPALASPSSVAVETVTVTRLVPETILDPIPDRHGRGFTLRAGGARFSVPHDTRRPFVVTAGDVVIDDLGTTFTVQYLSADRLEISVEQGRARVRARGTDTEIAAGARLEVPVSAPAVPAERPARSSAGPTVASSWRPLAERGRYAEAHTALKRAGPNAVRDETADLLLAADAARLGGFPADALPYLERVVRTHAGDPRAGLASFTLGRVLLDELGRPREAADAFARARVAGGPLAEDALAREVEATSRSGDTARSRELGRTYQHLYPNGRRAKAVARFGGLD
jgi:hypothetical protein